MKTERTWKERIMDVTSGRNSRGTPLWYSHRKICELIGEQEGVNLFKTHRGGISMLINSLVKSGHLERAVKPRHLSSKINKNGPVEYVYRQTGKIFKRHEIAFESYKNKNSDARILGNRAHYLWRVHRTLPKWFRRMMLY